MAAETPVVVQAMSGRAARRMRMRRRLPQILTTIAVIIIADLVVASGVLVRSAFVTIPQLVDGLYQQIQTATYWNAVGLTLEGWILGLGLAVGVAIPLGIAIGTMPFIYRSLRFVIDFLRPIPSIALIPLFILIFGITLKFKIYLVAIGAFWPMLFQTMYGVQDVDPVARDTARAYGLNPLMRFIFVLVPGATPYIATGLRLSATYALLTAVATELLVGVPGIGAEIFRAQQSNNIKVIWALIVTSGLIGLLISAVFTRLERKTLMWHPSQRESS